MCKLLPETPPCQRSLNNLIYGKEQFTREIKETSGEEHIALTNYTV